MTIQSFNIYTARGYAGDLVDSGPNVSQTGVVEDAELQVGVAVRRGTLARDITLDADGGNIFGLVRRELALEAKNKPSDGETVFKKHDSASILRQGYLYVEVVSSSVVAGQLVFTDTDGHITGSTGTATTNVTAEQDGIVGDIIRVRIDIVA